MAAEPNTASDAANGMINFFMEISSTLLRLGQQRWRETVPTIHPQVMTTAPQKTHSDQCRLIKTSRPLRR